MLQNDVKYKYMICVDNEHVQLLYFHIFKCFCNGSKSNKKTKADGIMI